MAEQTSELQAVLERLERVEERLRRLVWVTLALLAIVGGTVSGAAYLWVTGPRPIVASTIAAKEFLLVDDVGHVRASLRQHEGNPLLLFFDHDGKGRLSFVCSIPRRPMAPRPDRRGACSVPTIAPPITADSPLSVRR
jgi:hypothetical protein